MKYAGIIQSNGVQKENLRKRNPSIARNCQNWRYQRDENCSSAMKREMIVAV